MGFTSRDMYSQTDTEMLVRAVRRSQMSYQEIADEATKELGKIVRAERRKRRGDGLPESISKSLIDQLMNGAPRTHELRAIAIERALGVADGDLFVPRVVRGVYATQRRSA